MFRMHGKRKIKATAVKTQRSKRLNAVGFLNRRNDLEVYLFERSINSDVIIACIDKFCETLEKKTVLVIDNSSIHTSNANIKEIYANIKLISATASTQQEPKNPIGSSTKSPELKKNLEEKMKQANQALNKSDTQNSLRLYKLAAQIFQEKKSPRVKEVQQIINALEGKNK